MSATARKLPGFLVTADDRRDAGNDLCDVIQRAVRAAWVAEVARLERELAELLAAGAVLDDLVVVLPWPGSVESAHVVRRADVALDVPHSG